MSSRRELHAQTALRGIAAITVFIAHASVFRFFPAYGFLRSIQCFFYWDNQCVDLFFELSGFILCYVYLSKDFNWRRYAIARFSRIYPLYFAGFLISLLMLYFDTHVPPTNDILYNVLLVQAWPKVLFWSINPPTWSISIEVFLYIFLFPILLYFDKYLSTFQKVFLVIAPVFVLSWIYAIGSLTSQGNLSPHVASLRGMLCFSSGFATCSLGLRYGFNGLPRYLETVILVLVTSSLLFGFPFNRGLTVISFPLLTYLSASKTSELNQILSRPVLCWLGDISYSIYVWHWPILKIMGAAPEINSYPDFSLMFSVLYALTIFVTVLAISHLSHFYFERPVSKWLRNIL